ncbi:hypothetical protein PTTG_04630 [Puccinia triticina 1-1 BBBD Race 1]|uniref:Cyanovirin-N domain-containing protein n=1 Tax=Puccinia triticina (isolate 1-1 / race 1 (BBBD)) TaxID=630390 RepID=A0A180GT37_PUCT1|nr:hypothetical protein PTTG_04630 [Puccinia triticina 1-1 BBBD Race 1]
MYLFTTTSRKVPASPPPNSTNANKTLQHSSQAFKMRSAIAAAFSLALLNSASAQLFGGPLSVLPTTSFFSPGDTGISCANQGNALLNANALTSVRCGGSGGYAPSQMSCGNQGDSLGFSLANINALTSIDCVSY